MKLMATKTFIHTVDDRVYSLTFPHEAPLGECHDVAASVCQFYVQQIDEQLKKLAKKADDKAPSEDEPADS